MQEIDQLTGRIERLEKRCRWVCLLLGAVLLLSAGLILVLAMGDQGIFAPRIAAAQIIKGGGFEGKDLLITSSADGKTIYLWTLGPGFTDPLKKPMYRGKVEAKEK